MDSKYSIEIYAKEDGSEPFTHWLQSLKDKNAIALIFQRLQRVNFGDCKALNEGLWEFRIHKSPGYRVYYTRTGKRVILLLCGGNKKSQNRDIKLAIKYLNSARGKNYEK